MKPYQNETYVSYLGNYRFISTSILVSSSFTMKKENSIVIERNIQTRYINARKRKPLNRVQSKLDPNRGSFSHSLPVFTMSLQ